ncbi:hypothetical protein SESBI_09961 [Sesbania bispinosa]|nr:hypothetical protein SESBI_09961 [Sesbania bispinosa]
MAETSESTVIPPPTLEQRIERIEGSFGQILGLLKTLIPDKEIANDNSNNNNNGGGGPSIQTNVIAGEKVEDAREGKLNGLTVSQDKLRKPEFQKKEGEVHVIGTRNYPPKTAPHHPPYQLLPYSLPHFHPYPYPSYPSNYLNAYPTGPSQAGSSTPPQVNNISFPNNPPFTQNQFDQPRRERIKIDAVHVSYSEIYDALLKENPVAPEVPQTVSNSPPKWYNPIETCKYHMGAPRHTIEKCWTFKHRV